MTRKLLLMGGKRPQLRRGNSRTWTKRKGVEFLSVLADTCNVTEACRVSKLTISVAYRRRNVDAAFRASWVEAVGVAYSKLELVLLERAFNGVEKVYKRRDGSEEAMREYSNQLGLTLLKMHRDTAFEANTEIPPEEVAEIRERLVKKLQRLKARDAADAADAAREAAEGGAGEDAVEETGGGETQDADTR